MAIVLIEAPLVRQPERLACRPPPEPHLGNAVLELPRIEPRHRRSWAGKHCLGLDREFFEVTTVEATVVCAVMFVV